MKLSDCITEGRLIFFDANVLFDCLRDPESAAAVLLDTVLCRLRVIAVSTLFEVAFAKSHRAAGTLQANEGRILELGLERVGLAKGATRFDGFLGRAARLIRANTDLGDALLAATALSSGRNRVAVATRNRRDYACFTELDLVDEFF